MNVLRPGQIDTSDSQRLDKETREMFESLIPRGKMGRRTVHWLQRLGAAGKNRALTRETAEPLVSGEGLFLEILAGADTSAGNRADYLCAVVPDLADKRDGASLAMGIARDWAGLKEVCGAAQTGNRRARIALAFVPSAVACLQTLDGKTRSLPVSALVRGRFLPTELKTRPFLLREAIERANPSETKPSTIRGIIASAFRTKELEEELATRAKGGAPGRPSGRKAKETPGRVELAAALLILGYSQPRMIPYLYPLQNDAEAGRKAVQKFLKRYTREIGRRKARLTPQEAQGIEISNRKSSPPRQ